MKRHISTAVVLMMLASTSALRAQVTPSPSPPPDPHVYTDPGMSFTAPPGAYLIARRVVDPADLSDDLQPVAAWVLYPGKENVRAIQILMEAYSGAPSQWASEFESQQHSAHDGTLVKNQQPMSLLNGMPATYMEISYGEGFDSRKQYAIVFADGTRGVALVETGRVGDITEQEAKQVLRDAKAVRYPTDEP